MTEIVTKYGEGSPGRNRSHDNFVKKIWSSLLTLGHVYYVASTKILAERYDEESHRWSQITAGDRFVSLSAGAPVPASNFGLSMEGVRDSGFDRLLLSIDEDDTLLDNAATWVRELPLDVMCTNQASNQPPFSGGRVGKLKDVYSVQPAEKTKLKGDLMKTMTQLIEVGPCDVGSADATAEEAIVAMNAINNYAKESMYHLFYEFGHFFAINRARVIGKCGQEGADPGKDFDIILGGISSL